MRLNNMSETSSYYPSSNKEKRRPNKNRRIIKKKHRIHILEGNKINRLQNRTKNTSRIYSPDYTISVVRAPTPLYHSNQYEPSYTENQFHIGDYGSFVDRAIVVQMLKEQREENKLINQLRHFCIGQ